MEFTHAHTPIDEIISNSRSSPGKMPPLSSLLSEFISTVDTPESDFTPTPPWAFVPKSIQVVAARAEKGSPQDLEVLVMYMEIDKQLARQPKLLPILYGHFDKKIPKESENAAGLRTIQLVEAALLGVRETFKWLNNSKFPLNDSSLTFQYFSRCWPSIWRWMKFLYNRIYTEGYFKPHGKRLTKSEHKTIEAMEELLLIVLGCPKTAACKAVDATSGAFLMFCDMWVRISEKPSGESNTRSMLSFGMIDSLVRDPIRVTLLANALGGDFTKIAPIFLDNIRIAIEKGGKWELSLSALIFVMMTLAQMLPQLGNAFLAQNIVIEICRVLSHYCTTPVASVSMTMGSIACLSCRASLTYLTVAFTATDGVTWITQAIRSKFIPSILRTVIMCGQASRLNYDEKLASSFAEVERLATLTIRKFTGYLFYRSVLRALERVWQDPQITTLEAQIPRKFEFWKTWTDFRRSAEVRREVKMKFDENGKYPQLCANPGCQKVETINPFSICAACQKSSYCSKICQQTDWKSGHHRDYCKQLSRERAEGISYPISAREFAFLHFNAVYDIVRHRNDIIKARNHVLSRNNSLAYSICIDYTVIPIFITVDTPERFPSNYMCFDTFSPDSTFDSPERPTLGQDIDYPVVSLTIRVLHGKMEESRTWRSDESANPGDDAWHTWALDGMIEAHRCGWEKIPIAPASEFGRGTVGLASRIKEKNQENPRVIFSETVGFASFGNLDDVLYRA